ncbi:MAG TPA: regulatory protein RecX [Candidatus Limnocylindria bacterium]|nr:regulatory protein RecX [Candidatus Limnocylindria bacterium]
MPRRRRAATPPEPPDAAGAMEIAARFLGTRPRTRWEVERRLRRAGADEPTVEATLDRLTELGYLDDAAFARWWGEQRDRHRPRGHRLVEAELRQRGVPREVIETFREEHADPERPPEDAGLPATELERAIQALDGHLRGRPLPADRKQVQRIGMFLMRRGFDAETARQALRSAGSDPTETDDERTNTHEETETDAAI